MRELFPKDIEEIADLIELFIICKNLSNTTIPQITQFSLANWDVEDTQISSALEIIRKRQNLLGDLYPFKIDEISLKKLPNLINYIYIPLLFLSRQENVLPWQEQYPKTIDVDIFEQITVLACKRFLGDQSNSVIFGWPSKLGRPKEFPAAIEWIANLMHVQPGVAYRPPRRKDGGVDVIAWRSFPDRKSGFPILLVQCTLQRDCLLKARDIDLRLWLRWLQLDLDPIIVLAIPKTILRVQTWNEISINAILFDRLRLTTIVGPDFDSEEIKLFTKKLLNTASQVGVDF